MRKVFVVSILIIAFVFMFNAKALTRRSWTELGGLWQCHEESAPSYDPGWRCANGEKPDCWKTICVNIYTDQVTQAYGCEC